MRNGSGLVDTFIHSAVWSVARRFISTIPLPIIVVIGGLFLFLFVMGKVKSSRPKKANTTVVKKDGSGNIISTTTTVRK